MLLNTIVKHTAYVKFFLKLHCMQKQFTIVYFVSYKIPVNNGLSKQYLPETRNKVELTPLLTTTMLQQPVVQTALQPFPTLSE